MHQIIHLFSEESAGGIVQIKAIKCMLNALDIQADRKRKSIMQEIGRVAEKQIALQPILFKNWLFECLGP